MLGNINWTLEQHKQYAAEKERRAQRENFAGEVLRQRDTQQHHSTR